MPTARRRHPRDRSRRRRAGAPARAPGVDEAVRPRRRTRFARASGTSTPGRPPPSVRRRASASSLNVGATSRRIASLASSSRWSSSMNAGPVGISRMQPITRPGEPTRPSPISQARSKASSMSSRSATNGCSSADFAGSARSPAAVSPAPSRSASGPPPRSLTRTAPSASSAAASSVANRVDRRPRCGDDDKEPRQVSGGPHGCGQLAIPADEVRFASCGCPSCRHSLLGS